MQWFANYLANLATRFVGPASMIWFMLTTVAAVVISIFGWHRSRRKEGKPGVQNWHLLLTGLIGSWIFLSLALGAAAWSIYSHQGLSSNPAQDADVGPLRWYFNLEMEGGPSLSRPVYALTFFGSNRSQKEVMLKTASIVSAKNGRKIDLEVIARNDKSENIAVPLDQVNLIPPGAPIRLVAKFGEPDPNAQGKILGLDPKVFLETWSQFYLNVEDDTQSYRLPFNEGNARAKPDYSWLHKWKRWK